MLYGERAFFDRFTAEDADTFPEHQLWLRSIASEPRQEPCADWTIWQYADTGTVAGIQGPVDLNAFCGSEERFNAFATARRQSAGSSR